MDNLTLSEEWFRFAEMDLDSAQYLLDMNPVPLEVICYHCQQSAEKFLKGYIVSCGMNPPKIHDLDELCKICFAYSVTFKDILTSVQHLQLMVFSQGIQWS